MYHNKYIYLILNFNRHRLYEKWTKKSPTLHSTHINGMAFNMYKLAFKLYGRPDSVKGKISTSFSPYRSVMALCTPDRFKSQQITREWFNWILSEIPRRVDKYIDNWLRFDWDWSDSGCIDNNKRSECMLLTYDMKAALSLSSVLFLSLLHFQFLLSRNPTDAELINVR